MNFKYIRIFPIFFLIFILSGCLYPENELAKNQAPNEDQLELVQRAIDKYVNEFDGLVPIKTKPSDTPIFEKYIIDFNMLKDNNFITDIPGNAFENGGIYQYVLMTPEDDPRVKLIDLRVTEEIRKVNIQLDHYRSKHLYPPFGEEVSDGIYSINYKKLGFKNEPYVVSPYSNENLPIIMDMDGKIYIDYRIDLHKALTELDHNYQEGEDIRYIIPEHTPFVPAYSLPYTIQNNEPVFMINNN